MAPAALSFISSQVGERFRDLIAELSQHTGWSLSINPNSNQGVILEIARSLLSEAGWIIQKGQGVFPEKAEVVVGLSTSPAVVEISRVSELFTAKTGFRLVVSVPRPLSPANTQTPNSAAVEIPLTRIRLYPSQESLALDQLKLDKAIERARRMGISPPIQVRRAKESYFLLDGLYRLRAAQALGLEHIPAVVE